MASVATPAPTITISASSIPFTEDTSSSKLPLRIPVFSGVRLMNQAIVRTVRFVGGSRGQVLDIGRRKNERYLG